MKKNIIGLLLVLLGMSFANAQNLTTIEQDIKDLSKQKWEWMADKNVEKLATLFHDKSKFVHMSGTWNKDRELEIIESGSIWYKQADVHDVVVEVLTMLADNQPYPSLLGRIVQKYQQVL